MKSNNKKLLATILSILLLGVGQIIKGQKYKAFIGYSLFFLLPILFFLFKLQFSFLGIITLIICLIALYLVNILDALLSKTDQKVNNKILLSSWIIIFPLLFLFVDAYAISKHLQNENILRIRAFKIPSGSMIPTCNIGDIIIFRQNYYKNHDIRMGDIITFNHHKPNIIKRAIAFAGDTVEIKNKELYINSELINESYAVFSGKQNIVKQFNKLHRMEDFGPIVIPKNKIFVFRR